MIVRGISWLMSLGGPPLIGIDQIDGLVTQGNIAAAAGKAGVMPPAPGPGRT